ncbi:hypothetical protein EI427_06915 [Flammeovirga pectinis]|uniref:Uncharacterized protein n=1 Tax=Flammeovirga pectinis TaxID=2494373 RepID=A0A3Q9FPR4_9BACT|nr:hypothetical protein [Flammeovirga pectinis]AZQ61977.1 hypothetical protein EI427_06915 [Flammeovirga pectinis]
MNTQINTIFSKVQFKALLTYILTLVFIFIGSSVKIYLDVKQEKSTLVKALKNSQATLQFKIASKEIEKSIVQVRNSGFALYKLTHTDTYFLNDNGTPVLWIRDGKEKTIMNKTALSTIPITLTKEFKNPNYHITSNTKNWYIVRLAPAVNSNKSVALCISQVDLWLNQSIKTLPLTLICILCLTLFYFSTNKVIKGWLKKPILSFIKHLEYESQGIASELNRDAPEEWQNFFMEFDMAFKNLNFSSDDEIEKETEDQLKSRFHTQLEELRWAKEQIAAYEKETKKKVDHLPDNISSLIETFSEASLGILVADEDTIPIYVNKTGTELLGRGVRPRTEDDAMDVRKLFIAGTDVEIPLDKHPMILAKKTGKPQTARHIEAYNPANSERTPIMMISTSIKSKETANELFVVLISKDEA